MEMISHTDSEENKARCEACLLTFSIAQGFKQHSKACPGQTIGAYKYYLGETFKEGVVFECKLCPSGFPRIPEAELWKEYEGEIVCMCCNSGMHTDVTLHIHSDPSGGILCGVCTEKLDQNRILEHMMKHVELRSFLFKICSKKCLEEQLNACEIQRLHCFPKKLSCFICLMPKKNMYRLQVHLLTHGIEAGKVKCPFPRCFVWFSKENVKRHVLTYHRHDLSTSNHGRSGCECVHCFLIFESLDDLSQHIFTEHFKTDPLNLRQAAIRQDGCECAHCFLIFKSMGDLSLHISTVHFELERQNQSQANAIEQQESSLLDSAAGHNIPTRCAVLEAGLEMNSCGVDSGGLLDAEVKDGTFASTFSCSSSLVFHNLEGLVTSVSENCGDSALDTVQLAPQTETRQKRLVSTSSHQCTDCAKVFTNEISFSLHVAEFHSGFGTSQFVEYLLQSFTPGKLFECRLCLLPRASTKEYAWLGVRSSVCVVCGTSFQLDTSCHMHKTVEGKVVCGFCSEVIEPGISCTHIMSHLIYQSYLADICSRLCLETRITCAPPCLKTVIMCVICPSSSMTFQHFNEHIASHFRKRPVKSSILEANPAANRYSEHNLKTIAGLKSYLKSTFKEGNVFECKYCHLPRATELEVFNTGAASIKCYNCRKVFSCDTSCHIHKKGVDLTCGFCSQTVSPEDVGIHCEFHQLQRSYVADICSRTCLDVMLDTWPESVASISGRFKCLVCFASFGSGYNLRNHILSMHKPELRGFECTLCQKLFASRTKLSNHFNYCHRKRLACPLCSRTYSVLAYFERHLKHAHAEASDIQCTECVDVLPNHVAFLQHLKTHKDGHHACSMCSESFSTSSDLRSHEIEHIPSKICNICRVDFPDLNSLQSHTKFCKVEYACAHCPESLEALSLVRDHIHSRHFPLQYRVDKPYKCKSCNKVYYNRKQLERHNYFWHRGTSVCPTCGKTVQRHMMNRHIDYFHNPPRFECSVCKKRFKSKAHLSQHMFYNHTNDFPFKCKKCGDSFRRKSNLTEHLRNTCRAR